MANICWDNFPDFPMKHAPKLAGHMTPGNELAGAMFGLPEKDIWSVLTDDIYDPNLWKMSVIWRLFTILSVCS